MEESADGATGAQGQSNLSGKDVLAQLKIGTRVVKGPDWKWGDQVSSDGCTSVYHASYSPW